MFEMSSGSTVQTSDREAKITVEDLIEMKNSGYNLDQIVDGKSLLMTAVCKV